MEIVRTTSRCAHQTGRWRMGGRVSSGQTCHAMDQSFSVVEHRQVLLVKRAALLFGPFGSLEQTRVVASTLPRSSFRFQDIEHHERLQMQLDTTVRVHVEGTVTAVRVDSGFYVMVSLP